MTKRRPRNLGHPWDANAKTLRLRVTPSAADAGTSGDGKCVDTIFDWQTSGGHYDARAVRVCEDTVLRTWFRSRQSR